MTTTPVGHLVIRNEVETKQESGRGREQKCRTHTRLNTACGTASRSDPPLIEIWWPPDRGLKLTLDRELTVPLPVDDTPLGQIRRPCCLSEILFCLHPLSTGLDHPWAVKSV